MTGLIGFARLEGVALFMRVFQALASLVAGIVLARSLGVDGLAVFSEIQAWIVLMVGLASAGFIQLAVRELAACHARLEWGRISGMLRWASLAVIALSGAAALGFGIAAAILGSDDLRSPLLLLGAPVVVFWAMALVWQSAARGLGAILKGQVADLVVRPLVNVGLLILLLVSPWSVSPTPMVAVLALLASSLAAACAATIVLLRVLPKKARSAPPESAAGWKSQYFGLAGVGWVGAFSLQAGLIFLSLLSTSLELAEFRITFQVASLALMGTAIVGMQFDPVFSRLHALGDLAETQTTLARSCRVIVGMTAPPALVFIFLGPTMLGRVFGEEFAGGAPALAVLSIGILLGSVTGSVNNLLIAHRFERFVLGTQIVSQFVHVGLLLALLPQFGATGAAIAFSVSTLGARVFLAVVAWHRIGVVALPFRWTPGSG